MISQPERSPPIVPLIDASGPPVSCHIRGGAVHSFIVVSQTIQSLKSHGTLQARSEATYLATERTSQPPDLPALISGHNNRLCPSIGGPEDILSVCCHTVCPGSFWWKHVEKTKKTTSWKSLPGVPSLSLNLKPKVSDWFLNDFDSWYICFIHCHSGGKYLLSMWNSNIGCTPIPYRVIKYYCQTNYAKSLTHWAKHVSFGYLN